MRGKSIIRLLVYFVTLFFLTQGRLCAQGGSVRVPNKSLHKEDLVTGETVIPGEEFGDETIEEEEEESEEPAHVLPENFSHDQEQKPSPSSADSSHSPSELGQPSDAVQSAELPLINSAMPTLPAANTLSSQDQVALHFVEAGMEALAREDFEQAKEQLERALEIAPLQPYSYYFLGRLAFVRGEHKKALPFLQKADLLFLHGDQAWRGEAARLRGAVYEDLGDYAHARASYQLCLQLAPANLRAMSALARLSSEEPYSGAILPR